MKYLFLIAAFNALFFTVLLMQKKHRALHDIILLYWLIWLGFYIGVYAFYSHDLFVHYRLLSICLLSFLMLFGPFLYHYILILVSDRKQILLKDLLHLIPFVLFNLYILWASFFPAYSERLSMEKLDADYNPPLLFLGFLIAISLSGPVYFLLTVKLFRKLDINIFNNFSNSINLDLSWIRKLVLIFGVAWTALVAVTVIHHVFHMFSMAFCTDGLFLSLSVFVILIGYFGLKQKIIYNTEDIIVPPDTAEVPAKYSGSRLTDEEAKKYAEKLKNHMLSSETWLNPDLTLAHLAADLGIPAYLLSQVINEQFNLNFFDFVNQYRVDAFKQRIANPRYNSFSLLGIALDCGFNSKSAFNRIFKKATGVTPSEYKSSLKLED